MERASRAAIAQPEAFDPEMFELDDRGQQAIVGYASITDPTRSEEHTSELQSLTNLVCRLLLEKKKNQKKKKKTNETQLADANKHNTVGKSQM